MSHSRFCSWFIPRGADDFDTKALWMNSVQRDSDCSHWHICIIKEGSAHGSTLLAETAGHFTNLCRAPPLPPAVSDPTRDGVYLLWTNSRCLSSKYRHIPKGFHYLKSPWNQNRLFLFFTEYCVYTFWYHALPRRVCLCSSCAGDTEDCSTILCSRKHPDSFIVFFLFVILSECVCCIFLPTLFHVCRLYQLYCLWVFFFYFNYCHLGTPKTLWSTLQYPNTKWEITKMAKADL